MKKKTYDDIHVDTGAGEELLPGEARLTEILEGLEEQEQAFIVIVDARDEEGQTYLQAALNEPDWWLVEFRSGSAARHYRAATLVDFDGISLLLRRYAAREKGWKEALEGLVWRKAEV